VKLSEFNVMMLLTDAFGGFGGISRFNRDFLTALDTCGALTRTLAFPRVIRDNITEELPESVVYFRTSAAGKSRYFRQVMRGLYLSPEVGLVICGHIHLLPLAYIVAKAKRRGWRLSFTVLKPGSDPIPPGQHDRLARRRRDRREPIERAKICELVFRRARTRIRLGQLCRS